jgi:ATP-dependent helicase/nuclease subunit A
LRLWLPLVTSDQNWSGPRDGKSKLLCWKIYDEADPRLALPEERSASASFTETTDPVASESELNEVRARLSWQYDLVAATRQRAKTSVTELRRQRDDDESEMAQFVRRGNFALPSKAKAKLSAAEIGVAHHRFLQRVSLPKAGTKDGLQAEAQRLRTEGWLSEVEIAALDFGALAKFWRTDFGQRILLNAFAVQRELQFTVGLNVADLAALNLEPRNNFAGDEIVVVQGVVDLAVILPKEIWIVDFKTDAVGASKLMDKVKTYEPQLKLYAQALARIYGRPVTECALYFLASQAIAPIALGQPLPVLT